jgi:cell division protein FtsZ
MSINLKMPEIKELKPKITVIGVGGAGGNAVNNMIRSGLMGCEFVVANTDAQALSSSRSERRIQMGVAVTEGLGAGSQPDVGRAAAEEAIDEITDQINGSHMIFVTAGMGGGTGTGAAPIIARTAREHGVLTVGVVTKPFHFEGIRRMRVAEQGIQDLQDCVDTLIVIPNQNLFRIANERTTFADAFAMADQVLYSGVACITDLMVKEGLINLDFADVRSVMREMGKAMMGTGEASGDRRAIQAAEAAIANPLLDETSMRGAKGLLISITGGKDLTLFEVDEAATRIREEVDPDANIILGATFEETLEGVIRVSVVATGIEKEAEKAAAAAEQRAELAQSAKMPQQLQSKPLPRPMPAAIARPQPPTLSDIGAQQPVQTLPQARHQPNTGRAADADPGVMIEPFDPRRLPYDASGIDAQAQAQEPAPIGEYPYIPPPAETPGSRVPRVEDFPPVVQRQLATRRAAEGRTTEEDRGPLSLLRRLASVGLGRRDDDPIGAGQPARPAQAPNRQTLAGDPRQASPQPASRPAGSTTPRSQPAQRAATHQDQTYQPRKAELDQHGRPLPRDARLQDDELDIPAFLRRQAN